MQITQTARPNARSILCAVKDHLCQSEAATATSAGQPPCVAAATSLDDRLALQQLQALHDRLALQLLHNGRTLHDRPGATRTRLALQPLQA